MPTRDELVAGRYRLLEQLGAGAMGEVWKALDTRFESRLVAVKILREDETLLERIAALKSEIARCEGKVAFASRHRSVADALFKT